VGWVIAIAAMLSAIAAVASVINGLRLRTIHLQINSRMDKLIETTHMLGDAEGREAQRTGNGHETSG
jgi:hypothetical protein